MFIKNNVPFLSVARNFGQYSELSFRNYISYIYDIKEEEEAAEKLDSTVPKWGRLEQSRQEGQLNDFRYLFTTESHLGL